MSFFNWLFGKSRRHKSEARRRRTDVKSQPSARLTDTSRTDNASKAVRQLRRDQLDVVAREAMTRAGFLSSGYKFKVLSVDAQGDEFLLLIDLVSVKSVQDLLELETYILQNAKSRFAIAVRAVFWRADKVLSEAHLSSVKQAELSAETSRATEFPPAVSNVEPDYEPIQDDEVAAFKQALLTSSGQKQLPVGSAVRHPVTKSIPKSAQPSYALLTGFEDTELPDSALSALSSTQFPDTELPEATPPTLSTTRNTTI